MDDNAKIFRLRVLLCFLRFAPSDCTVTAIARTLGEEKYSVSRAFASLEKDGCYAFPFLIFREHIKSGSNISIANEGFEHPCNLYVKNGVGTMQLRAVPLSAKSQLSGKLMSGKVKNIRYFDSERFVSAELNGQIFSFPADVLQFINVGSDAGQKLHGSVCLQMECSLGLLHMPELTAIFSMLI